MKMLKIHCGKYKGIEGWVFFPSIFSYEKISKFFPKKGKSLDFTLKKIFCPKSIPIFWLGK